MTDHAYRPGTREELKRLVGEEIQRMGPTCDLNHIDVSHITDFSDVFDETQFNGNISQWDVSAGRDFTGMFEDVPFNGDISKWDVSEGLDFTNMFQKSAFNGDISQWNMSRAEDCTRMFADSPFNGDLSNWNTSNITCMQSMFSNSAFAGDIARWDVSNVHNVMGMFLGAAFDGDVSAWRLHAECMKIARLLDFVSHHEPQARKDLRLPILPLEGYRLFLSKDTMHAWLAERAGKDDIVRYHWDALLRTPNAPWATPAMTEMVQTYLSLVGEMSEPCIEHSALLQQSWAAAHGASANEVWALPLSPEDCLP